MTITLKELVRLGSVCLPRKQVKLAERLSGLDPLDELDDPELVALDERNCRDALNVIMLSADIRLLREQQED